MFHSDDDTNNNATTTNNHEEGHEQKSLQQQHRTTINTIITTEEENNNDDEVVPKISNKTITIRLPTLKYGYLSKPLTWEELRVIIQQEQNYDKLTRSKEQQYQYEVKKYHILQQYHTMMDYILCTKFPTIFTKQKMLYPISISSSSHMETTSTTTTNNNNSDTMLQQQQRYQAYPTLEQFLSTTTQQSYTAIVLNDFPYHIERTIQHYILWKIGGGTKNLPSSSGNVGGCIDHDDIQHAKEYISTTILHSTNISPMNHMIHWINPIHLQSIPLIHHAHILVKIS